MKNKTLELSAETHLDQSPKTVFRNMSFDATGDLLLSWIDQDGSLVIRSFGRWPLCHEIANTTFRFPIVQRFKDGRWLIADARCLNGVKNVEVRTQSFDILDRFEIGDSIAQVVVDQKDNVWVGYFDENPLGLRRFSADGQLTYDFNVSSGHDIFDLYAMHLDAQGDIWVYPYTDFYLARISSENVQVVMEKCPIEGARAIMVGGNHIAFFGSYEDSDVFVFDLRSQKGIFVKLYSEGNPISRLDVATQGETAAILLSDRVCTISLGQLIAAVER